MKTDLIDSLTSNFEAHAQTTESGIEFWLARDLQHLLGYTPTHFSDLRAVVYDFADSRAGEHARTFLANWQGKLVCDDYGGYKAGFQKGITEIGCPSSR